ncbi:substrate-binding domain-containing protein [bacterium]|nr:substrate-binding domain-containing protein [bacterium]MDY3021079.1 substrate-binding domain-containing protein [Oliverpabstia sp.]
MKKKVLSVLLSTAMVATMFAGCGSKEASSESATSDDAATEDTADAAEDTADDGEAAPAGDMHFEIVSKGFQHAYWQAVKKGAENKAAELGVTINFVGPNTESDIADQVQMLNNAINAGPNAIGFAALDTSAALDAIQTAMDSGIPIIGFDSGVSGAPEGSVLANASTDNYAAGALAAEETYKVIKDRIANASGSVRIGVLSQDATAESIINRGLGFIDKIAELIQADGKTVTVEGNDKYVTDSKVEPTDGADVIIEVAVPASVDASLSKTDCETILNKEDTICIYGSNQHSGEAMVSANETLQKFGTGDDKVIGVAFDSGAVIKGAVADGTFVGAITQAPVAMGEKLVELMYAAANGEAVEDTDTGCQWYTAENMESEEIAQNLYD